MKRLPPVLADRDPARTAMYEHYHADETRCVKALLHMLESTESQQRRIESQAAELVEQIRHQNESHGGLDAFLLEFKLSSEEGVALMCLAEALLRVPDTQTADQLIQDKLSDGDWASHLGGSESFFVNASVWGLMLTGKVVSLDKTIVEDAGDFLGRLVARSGEPLIRAAVKQAVRIMGKQFVLAESIHRGLRTAAAREREGYTYSYDMLGEAVRTAGDAARYFSSYQTAIKAIGTQSGPNDPISSPGISVKLSALHPRFEYAQRDRVLTELYPRLKQLCVQAKQYRIGLTVDAEEADRLDPSLTLLQQLCSESELDDWNGLGFVVQAYQKRAPHVIDWIEQLVLPRKRRIMIRLVKGAYWDSEIKLAQLEGYPGYPVFTRKVSTDLSYLACAQKLLKNPAAFYPLFATHNAHTVASILDYAGPRRDFEFQCLHGMGEMLYRHVMKTFRVNCRIYAPVGSHRDLLAYLVRRLLENGANSSFVNRLVDRELPVGKLVSDPVQSVRALASIPHPDIPLPQDIYGHRKNAQGWNLNNEMELVRYFQSIASFSGKTHHMYPLTAHRTRSPSSHRKSPIRSPSSAREIGTVATASEEDVRLAVEAARAAHADWDRLGGTARGDILLNAADRFEAHRDELMSLCTLEAGKTLRDSLAELREAVDFLRYYSLQGQQEFSRPLTLGGPTGELNQWSLKGRGTFVCISPWNFPLAIFTGQVSAALAAGNCVLAKPAEQTPLIAFRAVQLLRKSGVPDPVLQLLPGEGGSVGAQLVRHPAIDGVAFTGSTDTAKTIQRSLAGKPGPIVPLIAETGGINAMIVDSTALPEQVVRDAVQSAFQSAGQRCSALRVLYVQQDIAKEMITMLKGAMDELKIGDPAEMDTDVGPIIDPESRANVQAYVRRKTESGTPVYVSGRMTGKKQGYFFRPALLEISGIGELKKEVFGPVLHVCRFKASEIDRVVDEINHAGYGLTFGIHSRIESTIERITRRIKVGNAYVNRNTIGAVVGIQPFGGEGLSGTGPKAGGPHYLHRFAVERSVSTDTTASGGNASLLSLDSQ
ncbi:MAG: bifunctional proline dehydrogenase/L-glutamate gamma-semialdehyde dehydrogenase PutA [Gammaproteobacteria bacterium]|nr:bifunctional proline dehydrogenase/L-glutamate gamma-semialdehyde dehydrogenase PutA [Gammaproteobacteria bacterium]